MKSIVVVGAGPAGVVCALGLHRLGLNVVVVNTPRKFSAVEGTTQRVLNSFQQLGLTKALATIKEACARDVVWNGQENSQNMEFLIDRPAFDKALISELLDVGIQVVNQSVTAIEERDDVFFISLKDGSFIEAGFFVEARGRQASASGKGMRGPETISLLNRWTGLPGNAGTRVISLPDAWCWMAKMTDGRCYWQLTLDVKAARLSGRSDIIGYCAERRRSCSATQQFFQELPELNDIDFHARSSTATLSKDIVGQNWIRIGDAAMAVDPLSGNGVFQAMSSALQAPAVINTLIHKPENGFQAKEFHKPVLFMRALKVTHFRQLDDPLTVFGLGGTIFGSVFTLSA